MSDSTLLSSLLAATVAVFAHACFQLAVSVLTLLSSHSIGMGRSHLRVLRLGLSYVVGAFVGTALITFAAASLMNATLMNTTADAVRTIVIALNILIGLAVMLFYYRRGKGTMLWVPRGAAEFLTRRAKKTTYAFEAFGLGLLTVIAELPFLAAPVATIAYLLGYASPDRIDLVVAYSAVAVLPLVCVTGLISSGHRISTIQRWREANKTFLQVSSGGALIVLGCFLFARFGMGVQS